MFDRRTSDEQMLWQTLRRRQWLRKTSLSIAKLTLQERRPEPKS